MGIAGDNIKADRGNWSFKGAAVKNFDNHINNSVPLYEQGHDLICDISDFLLMKTP